MNVGEWMRETQESAERKLAGRARIEEAERAEFSPVELISLCTCDILIPGPVTIDPGCPVHWDLVDPKG